MIIEFLNIKTTIKIIFNIIAIFYRNNYENIIRDIDEKKEKQRLLNKYKS